jgi:hypothetical protein
MEVLTIAIPLQPFVERLVLLALFERLADSQATDGRMEPSDFFVEATDPAVAHIVMTVPTEHLVDLINQADRVFLVFLVACAREQLDEVADGERVGPKISTRTFDFRNKPGPLRELQHQASS